MEERLKAEIVGQWVGMGGSGWLRWKEEIKAVILIPVRTSGSGWLRLYSHSKCDEKKWMNGSVNCHPATAIAADSIILTHYFCHCHCHAPLPLQ
jgi:hypothetical protein